MEARIVFLPSPHLAALTRAEQRAYREPCVRRSPLLAAAPSPSGTCVAARSRESRPSQLKAAGARIRFELRSKAPIDWQLCAASDRRSREATKFTGRQLVAAGARPATGAAFFKTDSTRSTDRCALPGTEGATRAHVDSLTTLVSTSPRRFLAMRAALCPRAAGDTLSPDFSPNPWLVTILSSSTSISQKPASH